jgi:hypothetical protein
MPSLLSRKKRLLFFAAFLFFVLQAVSQNVGINTTTPEATLDINGDIIIRTSPLSVADGITLALDVNTTRYSYYKLTGPTADFTLAGITAGIDGRLVTLFNRSGFAMQLTNEDPTAAPGDMIITGTNAAITIPNKGIVNLQYDSDEQMWVVKSSNKGASVSGAGYWDTDGVNIFNINTGNVGIGTNTPATPLAIKTPINSAGWTHIGGNDSIIVSEGIGGVSAAIGTTTNHAFRLNTNGTGKLHIYPAGEVIVGSNNSGSFGKFTVETPNNSYGISHISTGGNILATNIGGTSAGIGTFSFTNMRIFSNSVSCILIAAATGNVGIGTDNPTYKLSVNGNIRSKEVVVETGWADYVFQKNYQLPSLRDVEKFIELNKHLPNIPSAAEIEANGLHLGDTQKKMMEKIEELTLYLIEANKRIERLEQLIKEKN